MTFQWDLAAGMMYIELGVVVLFLVPYISNTRWQKFFRLNALQQLAATCKLGFVCAVGFQLILFVDSTREAWKLHDQLETKNMSANEGVVKETLVRMFRAQRNMYISGFALFLLLVIVRLQKLISSSAMTELSLEAFKRQAQNASKTAEQFMEECERLKLDLALKHEMGMTPSPPTDKKIPPAGQPERFGDHAGEVTKRARALNEESSEDEADKPKDVVDGKENKKDD